MYTLTQNGGHVVATIVKLIGIHGISPPSRFGNCPDIMPVDATHQRPIGLFFRREAYGETTKVRQNATPGRPSGLMGREVASQQFLRALLRHGSWSRIEAVLQTLADRSAMQSICKQELAGASRPRRVRFTPVDEIGNWIRGGKDVVVDPPTEASSHEAKQTARLRSLTQVLHFASPPEPRFAWARQRYKRHAFALSGVTHTLCSAIGTDILWQLLHAPVYPYDTLVSTSTAVTRMLKDLTDVMTDYHSSRWGGDARFDMTIEQLPLGVDCDHHQPATPSQRDAARQRLGITPGQNDVVLLFVGRLSHHAKAHPYPTFAAAQRTAESNPQQTIHLVLAGWFSNDAVRDSYIACAAMTAPNIKLHLVDGLDPWWRDHVWDAADIFVSLADSIQETFGLTNLEAMARGLPVVATDWNGYRDTVVAGETGFLIPTAMVRGTNTDAAVRLITGEIQYDQFLGEVGQTVLVSTPHACQAIAQLVGDVSLRQRLGAAGRSRVEARFDWKRIIPLYENLWARQREELYLHQQARLRTHVASQSDTSKADDETKVAPGVAVHTKQHFPVEQSPARYPPVETVFAGYPSVWLDRDTELSTNASPGIDVDDLVTTKLLTHSNARRTEEPQLLKGILDVASRGPRTVGQIRDRLQHQQLHPQTPDPFDDHQLLGTIAWLLKYDLLRVNDLSQLERHTTVDASTAETPVLTFVTTCMGRLSDLKNTLPRLVQQPRSRVVVVDYSCPESCGDWVQANHPEVTVIRVPGKNAFDRSDAKNRGVAAANSPWICLIDADVELEPEFAETVIPSLQPGCFFRSSHPGEGTGGTFVVTKEDFGRVGGHDPVFQGWGEEDDDLIDALKFAGLQTRRYSATLIQHRDHDDDARTQFHQDDDRRHSHMINRIYRCAKWDLARLSGAVPPLKRRRAIYELAETEVRKLIGKGKPGTVRIDTGSMQWTPIASHSRRVLEYTISPADEGAAGEYEKSFKLDA